MRRSPSKGGTSLSAYLLIAPLLISAQYLLVALAHWSVGATLVTDKWFWLFPLRRMFDLQEFGVWLTALVFTLSLAAAGLLGLLSFRRAGRSGRGYSLAAMTIVPTIHIAAAAILALLPKRRDDEVREEEQGRNASHIAQGTFAGVAIIVLAVLISAVTFGAYGWGLFVGTPFLAGFTTGYLANRDALLTKIETMILVGASGLLGTLALLMLALEGLACILLIAPLAGAVAVTGGLLGRALAKVGHWRGKPLVSVAILPLLFAMEAAMPPSLSMVAEQAIDIAAPPEAVWQALISSEPIGLAPGLVGQAGLAYPLRGRLTAERQGAERIGEFSTGTARERITGWEPGRRLAFEVLTQPPAMEEMSPYRRVHAPHVEGYFDTSWTSFELEPLPGGGTRLTARAAHELRIDPAIYWEPIARWAIHLNVSRVLQDLKGKAER
jgi:hypothetical protein